MNEKYISGESDDKGALMCLNLFSGNKYNPKLIYNGRQNYSPTPTKSFSFLGYSTNINIREIQFPTSHNPSYRVYM
jgi:hypothetical protein